MLEVLYRCDNYVLYNISSNFIVWAKAEGCWWWIKGGANKCLKKRVIRYRGSFDRKKKEEFAIHMIPFTDYIPSKTKAKKLSTTDYNTFKALLIEEWLKFINQSEDIKKAINREYDIVTDPEL